MALEEVNVKPADPSTTSLNMACFDLMLIELVPLADRLASQLYQKSLHNLPPRIPTTEPKDFIGKTKPSDGRSRDMIISPAEQEELHEAAHYRLEALGYRVGLGVVESLSSHAPLPSFGAGLDTIKFLCKDLWTAVFRKQIDNLKTNHRGVYVLTDNSFAPLRRCSLPAGQAEETRRRSIPFLQFPTGLVRGALSGLGMEAVVVIDISGNGVPGVIVTIKASNKMGPRS